MSIRVCKKCYRPLPEGYKYNKCENCRIKTIKKVKDTAIAVLGVVFFVGALVAGGKSDSGGKPDSGEKPNSNEDT